MFRYFLPVNTILIFSEISLEIVGSTVMEKIMKFAYSLA